MDNEKTVVYSKVQGLDIKVDIYVPSILPAGSHPALVLFHGGGMVAGNRQGVLIQQWLIGKGFLPQSPFWLNNVRYVPE